MISAPRLLLKCIQPKDIHQAFQLWSETEIKEQFGLSEDKYLLYKDMHEKGMETNRISLRFFLLIDRDSNKPIGDCGYHHWNESHYRAEIFIAYMKNQREDKVS